jgi:nucleotide-binding universal stress UspA family protein
MVTFDKILFPIDLSETSPLIVPYVKEIAKKFDAEVHLLFVVRMLEHFTHMHVSQIAIDTFQKEVLDGAEKKLFEFRDEFLNDLEKVEIEVKSGDIAEEIFNYVRKKNLNLIVMGTHGRKGLEKVFFGSIAERVVKFSPIPVLTVNPYMAKKILKES